MKYFLPALRLKLFMILVLGLLYPFTMTGISQIIFHQKASGDFKMRGGQIVGSRMLAQKFEKPEYFWPRPSAVDYNPLASGGSNLGQTSQDLKKIVDERIKLLKTAHADQKGEPPQDLIFASASGLDPHISPEAAEYQLVRVAKARGMGLEKMHVLILSHTEKRNLNLLGEPVVNVLALNLALDQTQGIESAPVLPPALKK